MTKAIYKNKLYRIEDDVLYDANDQKVMDAPYDDEGLIIDPTDGEVDGVAWAAQPADYKLLETVADMAWMLPKTVPEEDSREVTSTVIEWAREFEAQFTQEQDDQCLYMEKVEEFFAAKYKEKWGDR